MRISLKNLLLCTLLMGSAATWAQQQTWRCPGSFFTNDAAEAQRRGGCTLVEGGNISVIPSLSRDNRDPNAGDRAPASVHQAPQQPPQQPSADVVAQRNRLSAQINQVQRELTALEAEYNNGEPDRIGPEFRNFQKYLDRVERLRNEVAQKRAQLETLQTQMRSLQEGSGSSQ